MPPLSKTSRCAPWAGVHSRLVLICSLLALAILALAVLTIGACRAQSTPQQSPSVEQSMGSAATAVEPVEQLAEDNPEAVNAGLIDQAAVDPTPVEEWSLEILAEYPHDPLAYTQGLVFVGDDLWESTGLRGASTLRRTNFQTGEVLEQNELSSSLFGEGLAAVPGGFWQLTYLAGRALHWNLELENTATMSYRGEGWGLCSDGQRLWMSNGTRILQTFSVEEFSYQGSMSVPDPGFPVRLLNELECVDGLIYANLYTVDEILVIDPSVGKVVAHIDSSALRPRLQPNPGRAEVLNGIAYHPQRGTFFLTGKYWPKMFEVRFSGSESSASQSGGSESNGSGNGESHNNAY